jgi:hypothetical protein
MFYRSYFCHYEPGAAKYFNRRFFMRHARWLYQLTPSLNHLAFYNGFIRLTSSRGYTDGIHLTVYDIYTLFKKRLIPQSVARHIGIENISLVKSVMETGIFEEVNEEKGFDFVDIKSIKKMIVNYSNI